MIFKFNMNHFDEEFLQETGIEIFDYFDTKLPESLIHQFGDQLERAREILKNRSRDEITSGFKSLNSMLDLAGLKLEEEARNLLQNKGKEVAYLSRTKSLITLQFGFDIDHEKSFINATWYEYFALLSLLHIVEIYYIKSSEEKEPDGLSKFELEIYNFSKNEIPRLITEFSVESMEAISQAESLFKIKNAAIEKARNAGKKSGKKSNGIKRKVLDRYHSEYYRKTNLGAAKLLYDDFKEEIDIDLDTEDPIKRLEKWIAADLIAINKK